MPVFWIIAITLVCIYYLWIGIFIFGWFKTPVIAAVHKLQPGCTVVVSVRNEETNITRLLTDLVNQDYPAEEFEIVIVDDHSCDSTPAIIQNFLHSYSNIRYIRLNENEYGKKRAIHRGVSASRFSLILTTDADCRLPSGWIKSMTSCFLLTRADLIAGPVILKGDDSFLSRFQQLEFFSLLGTMAGGITAGIPVMCSSANLGFKKDAYLMVWDQNYAEISSGDDVFLLHALHRQGDKKIWFQKNAVAAVTTGIQKNFNDFIRQRKRWTSKSLHYKTKSSIFTALLVFGIHFFSLVCLFSSVFEYRLILIAGFIFIFKSLIDFPFLYFVTGHFGHRKLMGSFPIIQFVYFFYISFTAIASFTGRIMWKERTVRI